MSPRPGSPRRAARWRSPPSATRRCRPSWSPAEAELAAAEAALAQGQVDRDAQREKVARTVTDMYAEGDPELIAFSSLLDADSTEELTRRDGRP